MINMFTCIILMFVSIETLIVTTRYTGIDEVFKTTLLSAVEVGIKVINLEGEPYFEKKQLQGFISETLSRNLFQYTKSFELKYLFYDPISLDVCIDVCTAVQVRLMTNYYQVFSYNKAISYVISEGK